MASVARSRLAAVASHGWRSGLRVLPAAGGALAEALGSAPWAANEGDRVGRSVRGLSTSLGKSFATASQMDVACEPPAVPHRILDGKTLAADWLEEIRGESLALQQEMRREPGLAVVLVGSRPDSALYVHRKRQACAKVGVKFSLLELPEDVTQSRLEQTIRSAHEDPTNDGVLVQLPLPPHLDEESVVEQFDVEKDVDAFHPLNVGRLAMRGREPAFVPCTPFGCVELLRRSGVPVMGKRVVVLGNSNTVGTPLSMLLRDAGAASVTMCHCTRMDFMTDAGEDSMHHMLDVEEPNYRAAAEACLPPLASGGSATGGGFRHLPATAMDELPSITRCADILFVAVGFPEFVKRDWVKPGCVVVDVGINAQPIDPSDDLDEISRDMVAGDRNSRRCVRVVGDVAFDEVSEVAQSITPVPGGVGPMTIAALMQNTLISARRHLTVEQTQLRH